LPQLAQRYLGDADLWPQIYRVNRERLEHPDLLPLGVELIIPQLDAPALGSSDPGGPAWNPVGADQLVPVQP
jgi:hypothetical protein